MFFKILNAFFLCHIFVSLALSPAFGEPNSPQGSDAAADKAAQTAFFSFPRAAMLVEAPEEKSRVRTYAGNALWSKEAATDGEDLSGDSIIDVDVDLPAEQLKAHVRLQKNGDAALPASHLIEVTFTAAPESATGVPAQIKIPQMRAMNAPNGTALSGAVTEISEGRFLIALSNEHVASNVELLKSQSWFDIPLKFPNGRIGKLTFEKGADGQRLISEAADHWQTP